MADRVEVKGRIDEGFKEILSAEALDFIAYLVENHGPKLNRLLALRDENAKALRSGRLPTFPYDTRDVREGVWRIGEIPRDLRVRHVEITGPVDRKMMINALNSGADVYMADFEDSFSPVWRLTIQGQINLYDAVRKSLELTTPEGKRYTLNEKTATLMVRPRGLHLVENHVEIGGKPVPAPLFDYGLYLFHNARELRMRGTGPYFYIPKLENRLEAGWWAEVFQDSERILNLPRATIKCSVLIETITAAFEMDEIIYMLREHITALNLGRWDYIFSFIKRLGHDPGFLMPDRRFLTMDKHFLTSAARLLVKTCHRRGAYAIGGMAAQVPLRGQPTIQREAVEKVLEDKRREIAQGFDGAWVAHPDLVQPVKELFSQIGENQLNVRHEDLVITEQDLLMVPSGARTLEGLRSNISVCLRYLSSWLAGNGAVAINGLMEDTATFEIARAQVWQWILHRVRLDDGGEMSYQLSKAELEKALDDVGRGDRYLEKAAEILDQLVSSRDLIEFTPSIACRYLDMLTG
ncbi:Malate synthase A [archaeon HR01]|nr:Malate synthase A [archaeon HR01]